MQKLFALFVECSLERVACALILFHDACPPPAITNNCCSSAAFRTKYFVRSCTSLYIPSAQSMRVVYIRPQRFFCAPHVRTATSDIKYRMLCMEHSSTGWDAGVSDPWSRSVAGLYVCSTQHLVSVRGYYGVAIHAKWIPLCLNLSPACSCCLQSVAKKVRPIIGISEKNTAAVV